MSETRSSSDGARAWPALPLAEWQATYATLHRWTQIVGKVRLALTPLVNHWWNVPLYVDARGLTTSAIPYGGRTFALRFDFVAHALVLESDAGVVRTLPLAPRSVADFHRAFLRMLSDAGIAVRIWNMPVEIPDPVPFDQDETHASYDREYVGRFFRALVGIAPVLGEFRADFIGKCSPVHFFWGSFDLAVTRFSGRRAPPRENADAITREAYSHEVASVGFWPGGGSFPDAAFYAYAVPGPAGLAERVIEPAQAFFDRKLGEFILPYDDVRRVSAPREALLAFCRSTYVAAADLARWDRASLERPAAR